MSDSYTTLWPIARQAPLSMGFSRQEHWNRLPCPPPGDLPDPGIEPLSLMSPALAGGLFTTSTTCYTLHTNSFSVPSSSKLPLVPQLPTFSVSQPCLYFSRGDPSAPFLLQNSGHDALLHSAGVMVEQWRSQDASNESPPSTLRPQQGALLALGKQSGLNQGD